ncbi:hypothetical protein LCGC14_1957930, partial [marine sediment metagenome]
MGKKTDVPGVGKVEAYMCPSG